MTLGHLKRKSKFFTSTLNGLRVKTFTLRRF